MGSVVSAGTNFPALVREGMYNKVKGKSSLARLSDQMPISFNGSEVFTFSMDKEIGVVGENAAKANGGMTVSPITIRPLKLEYGARVSDEFMHASEETRLNILDTFKEGFAKKLARAIDIIGMHGTNPRSTGVVATTYIDQSGTVSQSTGTAAEALESAVAALGDYDVTGVIANKTFAAELAASETTNGAKIYPDFKAWGNVDNSINGVPAEVNSTVGSTDYAIVGDFSAFVWGLADDVKFEVIEYGNPDNDEDAGDLKGHNQVYLRAEVYLATGVLDANAFKRVIA